MRLVPRPRGSLGLGWWEAAPPCSLPSALTWDEGASRGAPSLLSLGAARPPAWTEERLEARQRVVGGGGRLLSLSFMLQSLESRFLPAGTGGEVPSGRSLMGVSCGERASELGLPAPLPGSGPWPSPTSHPYCPQTNRDRHIRPGAAGFPSSPVFLHSPLCPLLLGHLLPRLPLECKKTRTWDQLCRVQGKSHAGRKLGDSARKHRYPRSRVSPARPRQQHDSNQLPEGWRPNPRPPLFSNSHLYPPSMPSPIAPRGNMPEGHKALELSNFPLRVGRQRLRVLGTYLGALGWRPGASFSAGAPRGGARRAGVPHLQAGSTHRPGPGAPTTFKEYFVRGANKQKVINANSFSSESCAVGHKNGGLLRREISQEEEGRNSNRCTRICLNLTAW